METIPFEIEPSWRAALAVEWQQPYVAELAAFVARERQLAGPVFPPQELVFNALWQTPYDKVSVVIVGQDPYHGAGQAHGLSFSVPKGVAVPPSLRNIFKEICDDVGGQAPDHGCLLGWAAQGVLLLNALLTVRQQAPLSHQGRGWERLTDAIVAALLRRRQPLVFLLWGKQAQEKLKGAGAVARGADHLILTAPHPSPLAASAGFFGCRHFSQANAALTRWGRPPIDWLGV